MTGWNYSDAFGKEATEVFNIAHGETRTIIESPVIQVLRSGVTVGLPEQTILIAKNGTETPIDDSVAPIKDDNSNITGAVLVFQDITERKQILEALARRQQEFKALVENAPDIISRFNTQLRYVYVNPGIEKVTGISAETFIGKTNAELNLPEEFCRICDRKLGQVFQTKQETEFECSLAIASQTRHYHIRLVPELASDGSVYLFQVYYQPIVLLETYKIIGFEALVRWQHPQHGLVPPDNFIPLAEETGLIIPIGYWVLGEACRQMRAWQIQFPSNPPLTISVNLSTKQFSQPGLIEQITQIIQATGLAASSLKLEITESVLMENIQSATFMLLQLQQMNIQLHLDDFGIGYSSLSYLHRFPSHALKIDRSFITKIGANGENLEIVQAIIALAQSLNIDVIAEGVETVEQLAQLRAMKCKYGQGYFFSQPLDSNSIETLIASGIQPR